MPSFMRILTFCLMLLLGPAFVAWTWNDTSPLLHALVLAAEGMWLTVFVLTRREVRASGG